jgi:hypothetical protein
VPCGGAWVAELVKDASEPAWWDDIGVTKTERIALDKRLNIKTLVNLSGDLFDAKPNTGEEIGELDIDISCAIGDA